MFELEDEDITELIKFFYMTYQRFSEEKYCLSLKPEKLFPIQQRLIEKKGIGLLHRTLFSIQKKHRIKRSEEDSIEETIKLKENIKIEELKIYKQKIDYLFSNESKRITDLNKKKLFIK